MRLPDLGSPDDSDLPVYQQIARQLREQIESGEAEEGARLPTIRSLAGVLGVNRDTVSLAYESLASLGLVESTVGRGTFVRRKAALRGDGETPAIALGAQVEQLMHFDAGRPRYPAAPDAVSMNSLIPDPSLYPIRDFRRCLDEVLDGGGPELFMYGDTQGHAGLRETIAKRLVAAGIATGADDLVVCHGASQGLALAVRLFASPGESIAVESPTYHNMLGTLLGFGVRAAAVDMREDGPDLEALDALLARPDVKAFYTIPTFHNPMGTTTALAHRRKLLAIAARHGKPVIEDAFEMDLRLRGRRVPPLAALDDAGVVVHLSSFSKSLFPGVRTGAIAARGRAVEGLIALKHASDLADSLPLQAALDAFVRAGLYDRHLMRLKPVLAERLDVLLAALAEHMPDGTRFTEPEGGYQVWVELPFEVDTRDLLADAAREGVLFAPGSHFLPDRGPSRGLRLTIVQSEAREIEPAIQALARVVEAARSSDTPRPQTAGVHL
ncbi:MAG: PLP-dependent aminotransferase family protein [Myxococcota bacterium]|nr:PLP-dependent aminotransferase family protein [Myxococcota bacterium]